MDRSKIRPLEALVLKSRPLAPHAIAWSCDAELAVAMDNSISIFLPEYPKANADIEAHAVDMLEPQFSVPLQALGSIKPDPAINSQLCAAAGISLALPSIGEEPSFKGVGGGPITGLGAALGQVVRVEWSPNGLGQNLRPILMAMTTTGFVVTYGEHIDPRSTVVAARRTRSFKTWKMLWGLGAQLPIPDARGEKGYRNMDERIISFSWAREIAPGRALLAYKTDSGEVVVMAIQFCSQHGLLGLASEHENMWKVHEVARFDARGPHQMDPRDPDPDLVTCGSAFSLKWSPWFKKDDWQTATLAYISPHHVGFRRITIQGHWVKGELPNLEIESSDTRSVCLPLLADAFIEWEDVIWKENDAPKARGVIATPFEVKPFQVELTGPQSKPMEKHVIQQCPAAFHAEEEPRTNPITGLVLHLPPAGTEPPVPYYSLVRLSATSSNRDWYETNVPEEATYVPQWAETVNKQITRVVSRATALTSAELDSDSDPDGSEGEESENRRHAPGIQVHPYRFRLWGMTASPGGACTAVLVSKHGTQHPNRRGRSRVLFGWPAKPDDEGQVDGDGPRTHNPFVPVKLTTEGKLWESIYGFGGDAPDVVSSSAAMDPNLRLNPLWDLFHEVLDKQICVFCETKLHNVRGEAVCENGHGFATCTSSGLAIMAPGISRICAVCGLRCLKAFQLAKIAQELIGPETAVESSGEVCGGCDGKFVT